MGKLQKATLLGDHRATSRRKPVGDPDGGAVQPDHPPADPHQSGRRRRHPRPPGPAIPRLGFDRPHLRPDLRHAPTKAPPTSRFRCAKKPRWSKNSCCPSRGRDKQGGDAQAALPLGRPGDRRAARQPDHRFRPLRRQRHAAAGQGQADDQGAERQLPVPAERPGANPAGAAPLPGGLGPLGRACPLGVWRACRRVCRWAAAWRSAALSAFRPGRRRRRQLALEGEPAAEFATRMGLDPAAWRGLGADLGGSLELPAGAEVGFSASLSGSAGLGAAAGALAGAAAAPEQARPRRRRRRRRRHDRRRGSSKGRPAWRWRPAAGSARRSNPSRLWRRSRPRPEPGPPSARRPPRRAKSCPPSRPGRPRITGRSARAVRAPRPSRPPPQRRRPCPRPIRAKPPSGSASRCGRGAAAVSKAGPGRHRSADRPALANPPPPRPRPRRPP